MYPDRCAIERWSDGDDDDGPFPESSGGEYEEIESEMPCLFRDASTAYVKTDSGDRVQDPATVRFDGEPDVQENDRLVIDGEQYEVQGIERLSNPRIGRVISTVAEVE